MRYRIEWAKSAIRELRTMDAGISVKILEAVGRLQDDPRPSGVKKLKGSKTCGGYGSVSFEIGDTIKLVRVERIGHRKNVYK